MTDSLTIGQSPRVAAVRHDIVGSEHLAAPGYVDLDQSPPPAALSGVACYGPLPPLIAAQWQLSWGRAPVLGDRSADGLPAPRRIMSNERPSISMLMADLHTRELPLLAHDGGAEGLIRSIGLEPTGSLAVEMRQIAARTARLSWELPGTEGMLQPSRAYP